MRKLYQDPLSRRNIVTFEDIQLHQTHVFLNNLLDSPDDFSSHVKRCAIISADLIWVSNCPRFASAIILEIAYGRRIERDDTTYLQLSEPVDVILAGLENMEVSVVDFLPFRAIILWVWSANFSAERII